MTLLLSPTYNKTNEATFCKEILNHANLISRMKTQDGIQLVLIKGILEDDCSSIATQDLKNLDEQEKGLGLTSPIDRCL